MCSVFSTKSLENLIKLGVKNIKVPSGEITNLPLIEKINNYKDITLFISTGMSNWAEIDKALKILKLKKIVLMECSSLYPCPTQNVGINVINEMKKKYKKKYIYGFSDHTQSYEASILAIGAGAEYIEKHLTFSKEMYGSDAKFAMEPNNFKKYVTYIFNAKKILKNKVDKDNLKPYRKMKKIFEKKIIAKKKLKKGHKVKKNDLLFLKSKNGLPASLYGQILGRRIRKDLLRNSILKKTDLMKKN